LCIGTAGFAVPTGAEPCLKQRLAQRRFVTGTNAPQLQIRAVRQFDRAARMAFCCASQGVQLSGPDRAARQPDTAQPAISRSDDMQQPGTGR
jgi:hypothetical protein